MDYHKMTLEQKKRKNEINKIFMRSYYKRKKKEVLARNAKYRKNHKDKFKQYQKEYELRYPERVRQFKLKWYLTNKDKHGEWAKNNRDKVNAINKRYKDKNSAKVNLQNVLRNRIIIALKTNGLKKNKRTIEMIGCSVEELKSYIESKFVNGMTWENRGYRGWHIDHIKPLSLFELRDEEQQKLAFHYTNLQPLWMRDNFSKKNKYDRKT